MIKVDISKCTGCRMCETACSFYHSGAINRHTARIKVVNLYTSGVDGPVCCVQCKERYCTDCPAHAISIGPLGQVIVSPTLCTLCKKCERNCPIGAIEVFNDIVYVCDLCGGSPKCTEACTEGAITYTPGQEKNISLAKIKKETKKMNSSERRVYQILQNKSFVGVQGAVFQKSPLAAGGKVLRIDLSNRKFSIEKLDKSWIKNVIGGRGANTKRLVEELNPGCDPLGPENLLIFGIGLLTGTLLPASAYYTVSAKSPFTGILGDSAAGGQFAAEMKLTGFDQIIISGRADGPVYLLVTDSGVEFVDCPHLAGKTIIETTDIIRKERRDYSIQVAAIGLAGENRVLFASIVSSGNRVNGRSGMGAVMGSKNLKALAVQGSTPVRIADTLGFLKEVNTIKTAIRSHNEYRKRYNLGTTMLMKDLDNIGILPTNHFQEGVCEYVDKISGETLAREFKVKNKACFNCNVHCSRYYTCGENEAEGPEFETLCSFTSRIGSDDLNFALEMNRYLNQVGMDSISASEVIGWLMECQEKGLVKPADVDGWSISWGETGTVRELIRLIASRKGIGAQLADGATKFSRRFGKEAQKLVMQVKGLDIICGDPRGIKAYGLTYATASRGADHLRAEPYFELTERWETARERFGTEKAADRLSEEGKAELVTYSEKIALLTDCMTMCKNIGLCMDILNLDNVSALLTACTGIEYTPQYLEEILGECIERDFTLNRKFGLTKEEDTLPERFLKEPLTKGPTKGSVVNIKKMVDEYYRLHHRDR